MEAPPGFTEEITLLELMDLVNIPLEFEIVSRLITNNNGEKVNVYFFINEDGYLVFNVITVPININLNRFSFHSEHNRRRERVSTSVSAELLRLRTYFNRGDLTLRQFVNLRNQLLEDEVIASSGLSLKSYNYNNTKEN